MQIKDGQIRIRRDGVQEIHELGGISVTEQRRRLEGVDVLSHGVGLDLLLKAVLSGVIATLHVPAARQDETHQRMLRQTSDHARRGQRARRHGVRGGTRVRGGTGVRSMARHGRRLAYVVEKARCSRRLG